MNATDTDTEIATEAPEAEEPRGARVRSCVGCGERLDTGESPDLVRLIVGREGEVAVDARGGGFGRGAHVHARPVCLQRAVERGLDRSAKARVRTLVTIDPSGSAAPVPLTVPALASSIQHAMDRRIAGLIAAAMRSRKVALGADAVTSASQRGEAELVIVATDAAAGADLTAVRQAISEGRAVSWSTKAELGAMLAPGGRGGEARMIAVVAITSGSIAVTLRDAIRVVDACGALAAGRAASFAVPEISRRDRKKERALVPALPATSASVTEDACAPGPNGGRLGSSQGDAAPQGDAAHRDRGSPRRQGGAPRSPQSSGAQQSSGAVRSPRSNSAPRSKGAPRVTERASSADRGHADSQGGQGLARRRAAGATAKAAKMGRGRLGDG